MQVKTSTKSTPDFAPAVLMINNAKTGRTFKAGQINPKVLAQALGF
jgi:methenyltetrahydromethanopterin cyclohydrolase